MAKPERPPIFERLEPFAPWDQRSAPSLLDEAEAKRRAGELAAGTDRLAAALRSLADAGGTTEQVATNLRHLGSVAEWSAGVWRQAFASPAGGPEPFPLAEPTSGCKLCVPSDAAGQRGDAKEELAVLARVAVPRLVAAAVLLQAELGDEVTPGRERWMRLVIEELETTRADLELTLQSQLAAGDGQRLAEACAEVARTVC